MLIENLHSALTVRPTNIATLHSYNLYLKKEFNAFSKSQIKNMLALNLLARQYILIRFI